MPARGRRTRSGRPTRPGTGGPDTGVSTARSGDPATPRRDPRAGRQGRRPDRDRESTESRRQDRDLHDRGVTVRGGAGHHAAAAVGDRQCRTPWRAGEIGCGAGTSGYRGSGRLDKTGTLTTGAPQVVEVCVLPDRGVGESELLRLAAAAEHPSQHPLARAVVAAARERGITPEPVEDFESMPGRGVRARVGGRMVEIGRADYLSDTDHRPAGGRAPDSAAQAPVDRLEALRCTAVVVSVDSVAVGVLGLADRPRPCAEAAVTRLRTVTCSEPLLLTGDNARAASHLATQIGIAEVRAGLLPQDKAAAVRALSDAGAKVALIGDGVNGRARTRRRTRGNRHGPHRFRSRPGHRRRGDHPRCGSD
ncbi:HAD family hydrolase [Nocardia wallacei]|uniref:HAD family hydrolase n=1 Tax=Nocardia wallacei TaxID=480035 RepID=UPI00313E9F29